MVNKKGSETRNVRVHVIGIVCWSQNVTLYQDFKYVAFGLLISVRLSTEEVESL